MTEQEQTEEMAEAVICAAITANAKIDDKFAIHLKEFIESLYNAGYRKIDDNCAVITKAELKQYKVQAVKEFAEKLKMAFFYEFDEIIPSIMSDKIDELIKEFEK